MKKFIINLFSFLLFVALTSIAITSFGQQIDSTAAVNSVLALIPVKWFGYIAMIIGIYELAVRIFPTVKDYSIIQKIIDILSSISSWANIRKAQ